MEIWPDASPASSLVLAFDVAVEEVEVSES